VNRLKLSLSLILALTGAATLQAQDQKQPEPGKKQEATRQPEPAKPDLLLPLLVTALVTILGWYVVHLLSSWRDQAAKRREMRLKYLLDSYRRFEHALNREECGAEWPPEYAEELEGALADVQLLGTPDQVKVAQDLIDEWATKGGADVSNVLEKLRQALRIELGLESAAKGGVRWADFGNVLKKVLKELRTKRGVEGAGKVRIFRLKRKPKE
jgi:hypothetical protein